jgi:hypothetical protein
MSRTEDLLNRYASGANHISVYLCFVAIVSILIMEFNIDDRYKVEETRVSLSGNKSNVRRFLLKKQKGKGIKKQVKKAIDSVEKNWKFKAKGIK